MTPPFGVKRLNDTEYSKLNVTGGAAAIVAHIGLRPDFALAQTDLAYGLSLGCAERREAVEDPGTDLELCDLAIEVPRREALFEQFHPMHPLPGSASLHARVGL